MSNTPNPAVTFEKSDVEKNKVMGVLSYFGILVLIPIFAAKESPFARFHASQGLNLLICEAILYILQLILQNVPYIGIIFSIISLGLGVLAIMGIVNAVKGEGKALPLIGGIKILK